MGDHAVEKQGAMFACFSCNQSGSIIGQMSWHQVSLLEIVYFVPKNTKRPKCSNTSSSKQASTQALWVGLAFSRDAESHPQGAHWMLCLLQVNISNIIRADGLYLQGCWTVRLGSVGTKKMFCFLSKFPGV